jgi:hypothetical protein
MVKRVRKPTRKVSRVKPKTAAPRRTKARVRPRRRVKPRPLPPKRRHAMKPALRKRMRPKPAKTLGQISYSKGSIQIKIEQTDSFNVPQYKGPVINGTPRALRVLPPYVRISTSAINDFKAPGASYDTFYLGTVEVKNQSGIGTQFKYDKAIVMKSPTSDRFTVIQLQNAKMTFQGGVPFGVDIEMSSDFNIPETKGPGGQPVTIFAPYFEMVSGDINKGFKAGKAMNDSFYYGKVKVGDRFHDEAVVIKESIYSDKYLVVPVAAKR